MCLARSSRSDFKDHLRFDFPEHKLAGKFLPTLKPNIAKTPDIDEGYKKGYKKGYISYHLFEPAILFRPA